MKLFGFPKILGFVQDSPAAEPVKLDNASLVLLKAAEILDKDGWVQCQLHDHKNRHCAAGAIYRAASTLGSPASAYEAYRKMSDYINETVNGGVEYWNDSLLFFGAYRVKRALRKAAQT